MNKLQDNYYSLGIVAAIWGLAGFAFIMCKALVGLSAVSLDAIRGGLSTLQWLLLGGNIVFMAYSEGYKGFQKSYAPRLAARVKYLTKSRKTLELLLAPLFCMGFFNAPRKRIIISFSLLIMIVVLIVLFRMLPQPWRGILDAGVVIGLAWGSASTLYFCVREFGDPRYAGDPEVTNSPATGAALY